MPEVTIPSHKDVGMQDSSYIRRDDSDELFSQLRSGTLELQRASFHAHRHLLFNPYRKAWESQNAIGNSLARAHKGYMAIMSQMDKATTHAVPGEGIEPSKVSTAGAKTSDGRQALHKD